MFQRERTVCVVKALFCRDPDSEVQGHLDPRYCSLLHRVRMADGTGTERYFCEIDSKVNTHTLHVNEIERLRVSEQFIDEPRSVSGTQGRSRHSYVSGETLNLFSTDLLGLRN